MRVVADPNLLCQCWSSLRTKLRPAGAAIERSLSTSRPGRASIAGPQSRKLSRTSQSWRRVWRRCQGRLAGSRPSDCLSGKQTVPRSVGGGLLPAAPAKVASTSQNARSRTSSKTRCLDGWLGSYPSSPERQLQTHLVLVIRQVSRGGRVQGRQLVVFALSRSL